MQNNWIERGPIIGSIRNTSNRLILLILTRMPGIEVKPLSTISYMHLTMFAKPVCDRAIYKLIRKNKYRSFVEIGLQDGKRSLNMIQVAKKFAVSSNVRYTGVDQFDAREEGDRKLSLIDMHRRLKAIDAKTQLVPGDIQPAIARIANSHVRTDLIVISAGFDVDSLDASWFYFPRMLHSGSRVLIQRSPGAAFECMNRLQIEKLAEDQPRTKSMAA